MNCQSLAVAQVRVALRMILFLDPFVDDLHHFIQCCMCVCVLFLFLAFYGYIESCKKIMVVSELRS